MKNVIKREQCKLACGLPSVNILSKVSKFKVLLYLKKSNLDKQGKDKMTNLTLRERLGIDKQNYPMASRIIKDALLAGKIKEEKTENQSRNNKGYVPFWA